MNAAHELPENVIRFKVVDSDFTVLLTEVDPVTKLELVHQCDASKRSHFETSHPNVTPQTRMDKGSQEKCDVVTFGDVSEAPSKMEPDDELKNELENGLTPWHNPVHGIDLYNELVNSFNDYCVLPDKGAEAISLWVMASYNIDSFRIFPKLLINSPQKRCGKTRVLEVLGSTMPRALVGANVTPSVIFRAISAWSPSLLLDEVDTFIHGKEELRGVINSGHTRATASVLRVEGDVDRAPVKYSTWAPMALAMIGTPPDTILDRSIKIGLKRKTSSEVVKRMPIDLIKDNMTLRRKLTRWAKDNAEALKRIEPSVPCVNNDRAEDNWGPLFSVAELLNIDTTAEDAIKALELNGAITNTDLTVQVLTDIKKLFDDGVITDKVFSADLVSHLLALPESPWNECSNGRELTTNKLGSLLKGYGIGSKSVRIDTLSKKGYAIDDFTDAFNRYLNTP